MQAARAAAAANVPFALSTLSACSIGEVAAARHAPFWFQLYIVKDRGFVSDMIARAKEAGCGALLLTVDLRCRARAIAIIARACPDRCAAAAAGCAGAARPDWAWDVARTRAAA